MLVIFKSLFILITTILFTLIMYGKLFVFHKKDAVFVSDYTSFIAYFLTAFVILSAVGAVFAHITWIRLVFLGLAVSPFALGYFAKYETEKYFTVFQLILLVFSVVFMLEL